MSLVLRHLLEGTVNTYSVTCLIILCVGNSPVFKDGAQYTVTDPSQALISSPVNLMLLPLGGAYTSAHTFCTCMDVTKRDRLLTIYQLRKKWISVHNLTSR